MKITIDVDMTPAEFREAVGLPDVKSVQDRWMAQVEAALTEEIAKLSPEAVAQKWVGALTPNSDLFAAMLKTMPGFTDKG